MKRGLHNLTSTETDASGQPPLRGTAAGPAGQGQIDALTATRAVAAILVFIHHFGPGDIFPPPYHVGNIAVCYFFVLSGFVLYHAYSHRQIVYREYLKRRVARIIPVYLLALFLVVWPPDQHFECQLSSLRGVKEMVLSATLLQAYVPTYPLTLNLPGWTISVEMFFYLLFPFLLSVQRRSIRIFTGFAAMLFVASQAIHLYLYPTKQHLDDTILDMVFFSPFIHLSQFMIGMLAGYGYHRLKGRFPKHPLVPLLLLMTAIAAVAFRSRHPAYLSFQVGLIDPLFALLIIAIAINDPKWLRLRAFVFLGEISFGIYILQWPVYTCLRHMNERFCHLAPTPFFCLALSLLILFAAGVYYLFELPLKRRINSIRI